MGIRLTQLSTGLKVEAELGETNYILKFYKVKMEKNHPMVPPLDHFQRKNKNCSSLARTISMSRRSFFANLTTFERRSGLKNFSLFKIVNLKMG